MGVKERDLINARLAGLAENERLFRINAGLGWAGKTVKHTPRLLVLADPWPVHAAPEGWPDLCGFETVEITPDMVGRKVAIFKGVEVKATGRLSEPQKRFRDLIERMGGLWETITPPRT